jgi:hypothetical protein
VPDEVLGDEEDWSAIERALLDAALEFYGAAEAVIDYGGPSRPQLRRDAAGLKAVRDAMAGLEDHICAAHASGVAPERIAGITRLEQEIVVLIVARRRTPARDAAES